MSCRFHRGVSMEAVVLIENYLRLFQHHVVKVCGGNYNEVSVGDGPVYS